MKDSEKHIDKENEKTRNHQNVENSENVKKDQKLPYNPEITEHDLDILNQDNIHGDGGDDQQLRDREKKVDFAGDGLDVPGRKKARNKDGKGFSDEENKLFSLGGDDHDDLEENKPEI